MEPITTLASLFLKRVCICSNKRISDQLDNITKQNNTVI